VKRIEERVGTDESHLVSVEVSWSGLYRIEVDGRTVDAGRVIVLPFVDLVVGDTEKIPVRIKFAAASNRPTILVQDGSAEPSQPEESEFRESAGGVLVRRGSAPLSAYVLAVLPVLVGLMAPGLKGLGAAFGIGLGGVVFSILMRPDRSLAAKAVGFILAWVIAVAAWFVVSLGYFLIRERLLSAS
jgi:hypothetical protein